MTLFYVSILFMVIMVVLAVLPLGWTVAYERRRHLVKPDEIVAEVRSVRPAEEPESELLERAEAAAEAELAAVA